MTRGDAGWITAALLVTFLGSTSLARAQAAAPASATPPPAPVGTVTVTAKPPPKVIHRQADAFVQSRDAAPKAEIDQVGRWSDPVCVEVIGLPQADQAAMIKDRIESVAQAVGVPRAGRNCRANVEIVFTPEPQRTMDVVAQKREFLLGYYHRDEHDRLKTVTRPIQAWYVTATRGDGANIGGVVFDVPGIMPDGYQTEVVDDPDHLPPAGCGANPHFTSCLAKVFHNVFMVADAKALQGKPIGLLADYMAVLALSQARLDGCRALPSVIDVLADPTCPGREAPDGLTPADAAYLTSLYASDPDANRSGQQKEIATRMARILVKAKDSGG
jgi:hypothetical protein